MAKDTLKVVSLFAGCGGLDLGFEQAGFNIIWANEFDKKILPTYSRNFPKTQLNAKSITDVPSDEIPDSVGIIGGPPCQSWSEAGALRGVNDERGQLFFEFIRVLKDKRPLFFLAENVSGLLFKRHNGALEKILNRFKGLGYEVSYELLNSKHYGVPQDRERVIFVGYHEAMRKQFEFPSGRNKIPTLKDAIYDLRQNAKPAKMGNKTNGKNLKIDNHEYMIGGFSPIYMSRNRVRSWDEQSFTIQAGGRHAPIHPQANKMVFKKKNRFVFDSSSLKPYRRLSVRECARIQTFPDDFVFEYDNVAEGYKMVGNAVPVNLAKFIAEKIKSDLIAHFNNGGQIYQRKKKLDNVAYQVSGHEA